MRSRSATAFIRSASMVYTMYQTTFGAWNTHNYICEGLFLGIIPIKATYLNSYLPNYNDMHKKIIKDVNIIDPSRSLKLVVSAIEPGEFAGEGFAVIKSMVSAADWLKENVEHLQLTIPDYTADVKDEDVINAILKMRKCIAEDKGAVYVHCKAGRSRSAMLCAIYLACFGNQPNLKSEMKIEDAIKYLQTKRIQVELNPKQIEKAEHITQSLKEILRQKQQDVTRFSNADYKDEFSVKLNVSSLTSLVDVALDQNDLDPDSQDSNSSLMVSPISVFSSSTNSLMISPSSKNSAFSQTEIEADFTDRSPGSCSSRETCTLLKITTQQNQRSVQDAFFDSKQNKDVIKNCRTEINNSSTNQKSYSNVSV